MSLSINDWEMTVDIVWQTTYLVRHTPYHSNSPGTYAQVTIKDYIRYNIITSIWHTLLVCSIGNLKTLFNKSRNWPLYISKQCLSFFYLFVIPATTNITVGSWKHWTFSISPHKCNSRATTLPHHNIQKWIHSSLQLPLEIFPNLLRLRVPEVNAEKKKKKKKKTQKYKIKYRTWDFKCFKSLPYNSDPERDPYRKICGKRRKCWKSFFSFSQNVFYFIKDRNHHFSDIWSVICKCFQFEQEQIFFLKQHIVPYIKR